MSDKRYLGNIITPTPTEPAGPFQDDAAPGVWSLQEAFTYTKAGLWPTAGNAAQYAVVAGATTVDRFNIATTGNTASFGTLLGSVVSGAHAQSTTRAIFMGGTSPGVNVIQYMLYSSDGTVFDFGDLTNTDTTEGPAGASSSTRSVRAGGGDAIASTAVVSNVIDYITSATTGNATDFGDLLEAKTSIAGCSSSTRMIMGGGYVPPFGGSSQRNTIEYLTIASTGNSLDFGDLAVQINNAAGCASETRALIGAGFAHGNTIEYVTIASTGNAIDFGDLTDSFPGGARPDACSGTTRGVFLGSTNIMEFVTIATTGNAADFGDITNSGSRGEGLLGCSGSTPAVQ